MNVFSISSFPKAIISHFETLNMRFQGLSYHMPILIYLRLKMIIHVFNKNRYQTKSPFRWKHSFSKCGEVGDHHSKIMLYEGYTEYARSSKISLKYSDCLWTGGVTSRPTEILRIFGRNRR